SIPSTAPPPNVHHKDTKNTKRSAFVSFVPLWCSLLLLERYGEGELAPAGLVGRLLDVRRLHAARRVADLVAEHPQRLLGAVPDVVVDLAGEEDDAAEAGPLDDALLEAVDDVLVLEGL